jgi:hypothetical protein
LPFLVEVLANQPGRHMGFQHDERQWPLVKWRWIGMATDQELADGLARIDGYLLRGERFGLLIDGREGGGLSPEQRNRVMTHMKLRADLCAKYLVQAVTIASLVQRTLYYGINLIMPLPFPSKVFADEGPAEAWLREKLGLVAAGEPPASA